MMWLKQIFGGKKSVIDSVAGVVDRFVETKAEKKAFFKELYEMEASERANARNLYSHDSMVQKVYALVFLLAYIALSSVIIYWALHSGTMDLSDFQVATISSTFGAMSMKVGTITDFFFGSSDRKDIETNFNNKKKVKNEYR